MAIGDTGDMTDRLRGVLPEGWFPDEAPILNAVLTGIGAVFSPIFALFVWVTLQTRIATATGGNLDLVALDFFGSYIMRLPGEADAGLRKRIKAELFRPKATRAAVVRAVTDLTGIAPQIFEPRRASDTGAWGGFKLAWGAAGGWGTLTLPYQCFIIAQRASTSGIANVQGLYQGAGRLVGGWNQGAIQWCNLSQSQAQVTDASIYAEIENVQPVATIMWTRIVSALPSLPAPGAPTALAAGTPTASTVPLSWSAPTSGAAVVSYMVLYRLHGSGSSYTLASPNVTGTSTTVSGLTASRTYDFVVLAVGTAGPGPVPTPITATTT